MAKKKAVQKKAAKKKSAKKSGGGTTVPPSNELPQVRVRMFRQGLGDCFLITFDCAGDPKHLLIDCGTLGSSRDESSKVKIDDIAEEIQTTIGDGRLHLVIATHEHQDHLSGFRNKNMQSLKGKVDHVWLAWTENPADPLAREIAIYKDDLAQALAAAVAVDEHSAIAAEVRDLLGFVVDDIGKLGADDFAKTVHEAMEFVRTLIPQPRYCVPGEVIEPDFIPGFRFYVLGPPKSKAALRDVGSHESEELYHLTTLRSAAALHNPLVPSTGEQIKQHLRECPFDGRFLLNDQELRRDLYPEYCQEKDAWRRIDSDWLEVASDLALQLDNLTNNTSLALAIERIADGKVLLFPADAQQGSWLSWHDASMKFQVGAKTVRAADLLAKTVFYKVGHHCSHNATARGKGLEMMNQAEELVAFIPVDRKIALNRSPKDKWQMPARGLYLRLLQRCNGRVARADLGWAAKAMSGEAGDSERDFFGLADDEQWNQWKLAQDSSRVQVKERYIEYLM